MKRKKNNKRKKKINKIKKDCVICLENIRDNDDIVLECAHKYHTDCIITMVRKRYRKCPICRTKIRWDISKLKKHKKISENI